MGNTSPQGSGPANLRRPQRLSRSDAYALAVSRGYTGAITSMNRDLAGGRLEPLGVGIVDECERQRGPGTANYLDLWG